MAEKHRFVEMTSSGAITTRPDMKKKKTTGRKITPSLVRYFPLSRRFVRRYLSLTLHMGNATLHRE